MNGSGPSEPITVGVDGSVTGLRALDWAAAEASLSGCPLRLVHAYQPAISRAPGLPASTRVLAHANGRQILDAARSHLAAEQPRSAEVASVLCEGIPAKVLFDEALSSRSRALVVGSRGLGPLARIAIGSTSVACAARGRFPVVVVPPGWKAGQGRGERVVVGVDYTGHGETAVGYAFDFAYQHGLELLGVTCWEPENPYARDASTRARQLRAGAVAAKLRLDSVLAPWRDKYPGVRVRTATPLLPPVIALAEHSRGADLVVIGGRLSGPIRGRVLGSVARGILRHSASPVAVVRG
ncbi:universal stress protein [Flindersiella endophytica]